MAEKPAYNWQSMEYKELSFLDKSLNDSLPEQAALHKELRGYGAGVVKDFTEGVFLIKNASDYRLIHGLINDQSLNGAAEDYGKTALMALQAFTRVKGFKNTATGELDFYDPRCGLTPEEFKVSMIQNIVPPAPLRKPDTVSGLEVGDKKEIAGGSVSQATAEKMQEQMGRILDTQKNMDAGAVQSLQEEIAKQTETTNSRGAYTQTESMAEKTNEEKELDKGKTDENIYGTELAEKRLEVHATDNSADKVRDRQISEAMLVKETADWKEYAEANSVIAETVKNDKAIVTQIFEGVKEKEKGEYNAIIERRDENTVHIGGRKNKNKDNDKDKSKEKEPELGIFKQIMKAAKRGGHDEILVGADLSEEAKDKTVIAAVDQDLKITGKDKPKSVDLKKDYAKKLPPATRSKIRRYNVSNMTPEELKKYKRDRKVLLKSGRRKTASGTGTDRSGHENTLLKSKDNELQGSTIGHMLPLEGGRES